MFYLNGVFSSLPVTLKVASLLSFEPIKRKTEFVKLCGCCREVMVQRPVLQGLWQPRNLVMCQPLPHHQRSRSDRTLFPTFVCALPQLWNFVHCHNIISIACSLSFSTPIQSTICTCLVISLFYLFIVNYFSFSRKLKEKKQLKYSFL